MKKLLCLILVLALAAALTGCGRFNRYEESRAGSDYRMTVIYNDGWCIIHQDNETGVQYFSRPNAGSCVMVNADGTPYLGESRP